MATIGKFKWVRSSRSGYRTWNYIWCMVIPQRPGSNSSWFREWYLLLLVDMFLRHDRLFPTCLMRLVFHLSVPLDCHNPYSYREPGISVLLHPPLEYIPLPLENRLVIWLGLMLFENRMRGIDIYINQIVVMVLGAHGLYRTECTVEARWVQFLNFIR